MITEIGDDISMLGQFGVGFYPDYFVAIMTHVASECGDIEVLVGTNAKKAWEVDYWKGVLDAQEQRMEGGERHEAGVMEGLVCLAEGMAS